jgi:hypothetical protein
MFIRQRNSPKKLVMPLVTIIVQAISCCEKKVPQLEHGTLCGTRDPIKKNLKANSYSFERIKTRKTNG